MTRQTRASFGIIAAILLIGATLATSTHAAIPSRAVSLKALVAAMRSGRMTAQASGLCGVTRITGYVVDAKSGDVVLVGKVDPALPPLHLDDFVVALRNTWLEYSRVSGRTRYYTDPGCSIDPNPRVLGQLRDLRAITVDLSNPEEVQAHSEHWQQIGSQPQKVHVMGVPFDSRFAKVMVDADYYMKRLVNGSVSLGIDGFASLTDMHVAAYRNQTRSGTGSTPSNSMSRFWFSPGESTYEDGDGFVILRSCKVKLLTEEEFLNEQGTVSGMGRPDPLAADFARAFSTQYDHIASQRPIYAELEALFRFVAIARLMKDNHADRAATDTFRYLLKSHRVGNVPVSREVKGLTNIRDIDEPVETPRGTQRLTMILSSCGGVSMSVRPKRIGPPKASRPAIAKVHSNATSPTRPITTTPRNASRPSRPVRATDLKHTVLSSKKSATALSWDVPAQME